MQVILGYATWKPGLQMITWMHTCVNSYLICQMEHKDLKQPSENHKCVWLLLLSWCTGSCCLCLLLLKPFFLWHLTRLIRTVSFTLKLAMSSLLVHCLSTQSTSIDFSRYRRGSGQGSSSCSCWGSSSSFKLLTATPVAAAASSFLRRRHSVVRDIGVAEDVATVPQ